MSLRMESTEKCEAIIQHFNGKYIKTPPGVQGEFSGGFFFVLFLNLRLSRLSLFIQHQDNSLIKTVLENWVLSPVWKTSGSAPSEPLLCKFADGGQKKRQSQGKYLQNGRPWTRDGETVSFVFLVYFFMPVRGGSKHLMFLPHNDIALLFSSSREEWPSPMTQPQPYRMGQYAGSC